jgi:hypothetical protein
MKKIALAVALVLGATGSVLAGPAGTAAEKAPVQRPVAAERPVLDQTSTQSIAPKTGSPAAPAKPRIRSGIEVNPWIVPGFL